MEAGPGRVCERSLCQLLGCQRQGLGWKPGGTGFREAHMHIASIPPEDEVWQGPNTVSPTALSWP